MLFIFIICQVLYLSRFITVQILSRQCLMKLYSKSWLFCLPEVLEINFEPACEHEEKWDTEFYSWLQCSLWLLPSININEYTIQAFFQSLSVFSTMSWLTETVIGCLGYHLFYPNCHSLWHLDCCGLHLCSFSAKKDMLLLFVWYSRIKMLILYAVPILLLLLFSNLNILWILTL